MHWSFEVQSSGPALACEQAGQRNAARQLAGQYLARNPASRTAARIVARHAAEDGNWRRARALLEGLRAGGSGGDVGLLAELSRVVQ